MDTNTTPTEKEPAAPDALQERHGPTVGMRTIKTAAAAAICALIYHFFDRSPAFACIGAIFGLGFNMESSKLNGRKPPFWNDHRRRHWHGAVSGASLFLPGWRPVLAAGAAGVFGARSF